MNKRDGKAQMDAMLRHLGSGHDLRDFPGTVTEKLALLWTAGARGLIEWDKWRSRCELTPIGWSELTQWRRFGLGSLMMSAAMGITIGGIVLGIMWLSIDAADRFVDRRPTAPDSHVQHVVLHPADTNASPPLKTTNAVHEIPSSVPLEPPAKAEDPTGLGIAEVEQPKIDPTPTAAKETEVKKAPYKKFSHRRRHHATRRYTYR